MTAHSTFEVHLTPSPDTARVVAGLTEEQARALADAEDGVIVERRTSLDAVDTADDDRSAE